MTVANRGTTPLWDDRSTLPPPFREDHPTGGDEVWGDYGRDKDRCEQAVRTGFDGAVTVLRPPYVYGPRNVEDREQFLWARMAHHQPVFVPGGGRTRLQFCHAGYLGAVVEASCSAALAPGAYNVGEGRS